MTVPDEKPAWAEGAKAITAETHKSLSALPTPDAGEVGELLAEMRAGLEGVTPGPWMSEPGAARGAWIGNASNQWVALACGEDDAQAVINGSHLVRCSPDNIAKLLDHVSAQASRIKELEGERDALRAKLNACDWYWPEDDTSSDACSDDPYEIVENQGRSGEVIAISRGGVVETRYYASLPPPKTQIATTISMLTKLQRKQPPRRSPPSWCAAPPSPP
ncbi:hypothetical protein [Mesorhizobium sp. DCY119]|uniref:hypothetical protein n=1 Tax=Mesorhizobium sp. DCY119 TaxID=2108445 RepID=UPI000E772CCF|nr:hypothetical protein [Mesorhizobium sp. DCY119]RJG46549.1 hypothetical protein D3Y55_21380 [Mesorhizobium sp. DCY119]